MSNDLAPVCLFCYNRLYETKKTIEALKNNFLANQTDLFIFSDAPKTASQYEKVNELREFLHTIVGFKSITIKKYKVNNGLVKSIKKGVTQTLKKKGKVIVLEDDLITSRNFLDFMNKALDFYKLNNKIMSISGYSFPLITNFFSKNDVYMYPRFFSWGWATWEDRWETINWNSNFYIDHPERSKFKKTLKKGGSDQFRMLSNTNIGKLSSWAIIFSSHLALNSGFSIVPKLSKVANIGFSEEATHTKYTHKVIYKTILDTSLNREFNFISKSFFWKNFEIRFFRYSNFIRFFLFMFDKLFK